jgi:hypothetical protein
LQSGTRYYLGVRNSNPAQTNSTFTLRVDFDSAAPRPLEVTPLPNGVAVSSNIPSGNALQYFQFDVSPSAETVAFEILNPSGNVDLFVRYGEPLPYAGSSDYQSRTAGFNNESVAVTPDSWPAVQAGRWYLGVWNREMFAVTYAIRATEQSGSVTITDLLRNVATNAVAGPGAALTNFFRFTVTPTDGAALFEVYNVSGNVDLLLRRGAVPSVGVYDFRSQTFGLGNEQIVVRTNDVVSDLSGEWFIGVPNNEGSPVNYTIRGTASSGGVLLSGHPLLLTSASVTAGGNMRMQWASVDGERYEVQSSPDLSAWTPVETVTAVGSVTVYTAPLPISPARQYYRVIQVP